MGIFDFFKSKDTDSFTNDGINKTYYPKFNSGIVLREKFVKKEGILDGSYYEYHMWGGVKQFGDYKNGKKEGTWCYNVSEHPDNKNSYSYKQDNKAVGLDDFKPTRYMVSYKNGVIDGKFERYLMLKEGKSINDPSYSVILVEEGYCVNGLKEGEWSFFVPEIKNITKKLDVTPTFQLDIKNEVFIDYTKKFKLNYLDGVLIDKIDNIKEEIHPFLNSKTPNIQLKTIPDHIFSIRKSISDRNHKISFINRYSRSN